MRMPIARQDDTLTYFSLNTGHSSGPPSPWQGPPRELLQGPAWGGGRLWPGKRLPLSEPQPSAYGRGMDPKSSKPTASDQVFHFRKEFSGISHPETNPGGEFVFRASASRSDGKVRLPLRSFPPGPSVRAREDRQL